MAGSKYEQLADFHISQEDLYEEIEILAPLSKKQELYINDDENDIVVFGGACSSGKSLMSLLKLTIDCLEDKDYNAVLVRESVVQMKQPGSLWQEMERLGDNFNVKSNAMTHQFKFPNGAFCKLHYLKDNQKDFQGSQIVSAICDEATQLKLEDIWYLTSRLRGRSKKRKAIRLTCNPDRDSFLREWLEKGDYLLDSGLPDPQMDGVTTYLVQIEGDFRFFKTREEVEKAHGKQAAKGAYKFVFYSGNVYDNPPVVKYQPEYIFKLENMPKLEKERLLYGNWYASQGSEGHFKREDLKEIKPGEVPLEGLITCRAWDFASTKPDPESTLKHLRDPDWSRGVLCSYQRSTGNFYILDMVSKRDRAGVVENWMLKTARQELEAYQVIPCDPGSSGRQVADQKRSRLLSQGNKPIIETSRSSKLNRATNFLVACQEGRVFIVKNTFTSDNYSELESFTGKKGNRDDIMDCLSTAFNTLTSDRIIPTIKVSRDNKRLNNLFGKTLL
ncbi:MAG: phage terminase large subunit [Pseudomonadota bacterium]